MAGSTGGSGGTRGPGRPAGAGAGNVEEEGNFKCEPCNRRFKSHHALSVHFATSAAHKVLLLKLPMLCSLIFPKHIQSLCGTRCATSNSDGGATCARQHRFCMVPGRRLIARMFVDEIGIRDGLMQMFVFERFQNEKDELKASGWKAENAVGAADAGAGMAGASGMAALANQNAAAGLAAAGLDAKVLFETGFVSVGRILQECSRCAMKPGLKCAKRRAGGVGKV